MTRGKRKSPWWFPAALALVGGCAAVSSRAWADAAPRLIFDAASGILGDARGKLLGVQDLAYGPDGTLWVSSNEQTMAFDAHGRYLRTLKVTRPPDPKKAHDFQTPHYHSAGSLAVTKDGRLVACQWESDVYFCETAAGRVLPIQSRDSLRPPAQRPMDLAVDAKGDLYVVCQEDSKTGKRGVYKYHADGSPAFDFSGGSANLIGVEGTEKPPVPCGVAVDAHERIYVSLRWPGEIKVYGPQGGAPQSTIPCPQNNGPSRLTVTPDGARVFAATDFGYVVAFAREGDVFRKLFDRSLGARVTAVALNPAGELVAGFADPVEGAAVRSYAIADKGLTDSKLVVPALQTEYPNYLAGSTRLKTLEGAVYYTVGNRVVRLVPGNPDRVEEVLDSGVPELLSLAFDKEGNLYLASTYGLDSSRGEFVYLCRRSGRSWGKPESITGKDPLHKTAHAMIPFDLAVLNDGRVLVRWMEKGDWPEFRFFTRDTAGKMEQFAHTGYAASRGPWWGHYGLHVDKDGNVLIAGGPSQVVECLNPDGQRLWRAERKPEGGPGSAWLAGPHAVTRDSRGFVWVADADANRIVCLSPEGKMLSTYGHFGDLDSRDGESFCMPCGITTVVDGTGQEWLYVADVGNQRILMYRVIHR